MDEKSKGMKSQIYYNFLNKQQKLHLLHVEIDVLGSCVSSDQFWYLCETPRQYFNLISK